MYKHIIEKLVQVKIEINLVAPVWQDCAENDIDEGSTFGCMVSHWIIKPEYCIVGNETGGNLSILDIQGERTVKTQKDDAKKGTELFAK